MEEHTCRTVIKDEERNLKENKITCFGLLVRFFAGENTKDRAILRTLKEQRKTLVPFRLTERKFSRTWRGRNFIKRGDYCCEHSATFPKGVDEFSGQLRSRSR